MFKILVSDPISDFGIQQLVDAKDVDIIYQTGLLEDQLVAIIGDVDALMVRSQTKVTKRIMEAAKKLKVIGRAGVGVDNIDLKAATQRGIIVINAPDGNTITTCEHAFAMLLALSRHIPQAHAKTIQGSWDKKKFVGVELYNKTLGVVGMGRIGSEVAKRAKAFGMNILGYDPFLTEDRAEKLGVTLASVDEIVTQADFITMHTPLTPETKHMLSTPQFAKMKPGMRIVNCARGGIVDEIALIQAMDDKIVAGAAFDVFEHEPPAADHPFLHHPNMIVTPHLGASTIEAQENVAVDVSEQMLHILRNEPFKNAVNMPPVAPNVMLKLQPFFKLGESLGSFLSQLAHGAIQEIRVNYAGDLSQVDTHPLTRYVVKGVLSHFFGSDVNIINAMHLAKAREVNVIVESSSLTKGFTDLITVKVKTPIEERSISGSLLSGFGERIVQLDQYAVDFSAQGDILLIKHLDKPGIIGRVGSLLGTHDVNIATMQVGRKDMGGEAIMVLVIDREISQDVITQLKSLPELIKACKIHLD